MNLKTWGMIAAAIVATGAAGKLVFDSALALNRAADALEGYPKIVDKLERLERRFDDLDEKVDGLGLRFAAWSEEDRSAVLDQSRSRLTVESGSCVIDEECDLSIQGHKLRDCGPPVVYIRVVNGDRVMHAVPSRNVSFTDRAGRGVNFGTGPFSSTFSILLSADLSIRPGRATITMSMKYTGCGAPLFEYYPSANVLLLERT